MYFSGDNILLFTIHKSKYNFDLTLAGEMKFS